MRVPVYAKLVAVFLVVIIPIFILGLEITIRGETSVRREIGKSMEAQVHYNIALLERELRKLSEVQKSLLSDPEILRLASLSDIMSDFEQARAVLAVQRSLFLLRNLSEHVQSVRLFLPQIDRIIATDEPEFRRPSQDEYEFFTDVGAAKEPAMVVLNGEVYLNALYPVAGDPSDPFFIISMEMSGSAVARQLESVLDYKQGGAILADTRDRWVVATDAVRRPSDILSRIGSAPKTTGIVSFELAGSDYMAVHQRSMVLGARLVYYYPEKLTLGTLRDYRVRVWILSGVTLVVVALFSLWMRSLIARPLASLVSAFRHVESGDLSYSIQSHRRDDFGYLYNQFNRMVARLKQSIQLAYEEKLLLQQAELRQLQYQINPHFLYNGFFLLHRMAVAKDVDNIVQLSNYLRRYYRFITTAEAGPVPLGEEMDHLHTYVEIQSLRWGDRVAVELPDLPEECLDLRVPRLVLQPLVENAYEHGLSHTRSGGLIRVGARFCEGRLALTVEDNGRADAALAAELQSMLSHTQSRTNIPPDDTAHTGLSNIHRRLMIRFGSDSGLTVGESELGGLKVTLTITGVRNGISATDRG